MTPPRTIGRFGAAVATEPSACVIRMLDGSRVHAGAGIDRRLYWSTLRREEAHASAVAAARRLPVLSFEGGAVTGERARALWAMTSNGVLLPF